MSLIPGVPSAIDWSAVKLPAAPPPVPMRLISLLSRPIPPRLCPCHGAGWIWRLFGVSPIGEWWRKIDCECQPMPGRLR